MKTAVLAVALLALPAAASAQHAGPAPVSPYAGQETRTIKSLGDDDIAELRRGGGWGLAKAAELNGMPGPAHLLELADAIALTPAQVAAIRAIFERMKADAIAEGERLIAAEGRLEEAFRRRTATHAELRTLLAEIERSRAELRYIHLATHLTTPPILTAEQTRRYSQLRGYAGNPCENVPQGHDAAMWRRHNGC